MLMPEILRWAAVAAFTTTVICLPLWAGFWSHGIGQPLILARGQFGPNHFRQINK